MSGGQPLHGRQAELRFKLKRQSGNGKFCECTSAADLWDLKHVCMDRIGMSVSLCSECKSVSMMAKITVYFCWHVLTHVLTTWDIPSSILRADTEYCFFLESQCLG